MSMRYAAPLALGLMLAAAPSPTSAQGRPVTGSRTLSPQAQLVGVSVDTFYPMVDISGANGIGRYQAPSTGGGHSGYSTGDGQDLSFVGSMVVGGEVQYAGASDDRAKVHVYYNGFHTMVEPGQTRWQMLVYQEGTQLGAVTAFQEEFNVRFQVTDYQAAPRGWTPPATGRSGTGGNLIYGTGN